MEKRERRAICILMLLLLASCAVPRAERSTPTAPPGTNLPPLSPKPTDSPHPVPSETATAQFLIDQVGERYFQDHYRLEHEEVVGTHLIKAAYRYTHEPYVQDYSFTLFFDLRSQDLSNEYVSVVLLAPQAFRISPEEAQAIALDNGLEPTEGTYEIGILLGPVTNNRFAWDIVNADTAPSAEVPEPILRIVMDVEGGELYAIERERPMEGHGSPQ
jgi:hypothetical protein